MDVQTQWRGQPDAERWRLVALFGFSLVVHSILTPWAALLGLLGLLGLSDPVEVRDLPAITAIPVDIIEDEPVLDSQAPAPEAPPTTTLTPPETKTSVPDAPKPVKKTEPQPLDKPPPAAPPEPEPSARDVGDPVALSGSAGKLADTNANVRIKIDTEKVRKHPLGQRIGEVLGRVPQWHDFLGPAKLDPIRDVDRLLIAGPQLRDSSEVVAVLQYNVSDETMESAIDSLVQRSGGSWVSKRPKAASARADRAERIFSFIAPGLVAIVPPSAKADALRRRPKGATFPGIPGEVVVTAVVETPHKVYTGLPFRFPESLKWVRSSVTPDAAGGAVAKVEAEDSSPEAAIEHAAWLEERIISFTAPKGLAGTTAKFFYGTNKFVDVVEFSAEGTRIRGELRVTEQQLNALLKMIEGILNAWNPKPAEPRASASGNAESLLPPPGSAAPVPLPSGAPPAGGTLDVRSAPAPASSAAAGP